MAELLLDLGMDNPPAPQPAAQTSQAQSSAPTSSTTEAPVQEAAATTATETNPAAAEAPTKPEQQPEASQQPTTSSEPSAESKSASASSAAEAPASDDGSTTPAKEVVPLDPTHKEILEKFGGKWKLVRSDPYDEYLKAVGVGFLTRKLASKTTPELDFYVKENKIYLSLKATLHSQSYELQLNEAVENLVEKAKQSVFCSYANGKLTQQLTPVEPGWGKVQEVEMSVEENGELLMNYAAENVICRRYFEKLPEIGITTANLAPSE